MKKSFCVRGDRCFMLGASLLALAVSVQSASAQSCPGVDGAICEIPVTGSDEEVETDGATHIVNGGTDTSIIQTSLDYLFIDNLAGASIANLALLAPAGPAPSGLFDTVIVNGGTIEGDLTFVNGGFYINNGGTITGNLTSRNGNALFGSADFASGNKTEIFVNRAAPGETGVAGLLDPGNGLDIYIQSFASSGTYELPAALPLHFEVGGAEALGPDTVVTIVNNPAVPIATGLALLGDGHVVNRAEIDPLSLIGIGVPDQFVANIPTPAVLYYGVAGESHALAVPVINPLTGAQSTTNLFYGGALASFTNEGVINGDLIVNTASFVNEGELNLLTNGPGTLIFAAADADFSFVNNGTIEMAFNGRRETSLTRTAIALASAIDTTELHAVSIANGLDADLEGGLSFVGVASDFTFTNSGSIGLGVNPNGIDRAVDLEIGGLEIALDPAFRENAVANSVTVTNTATGLLEGGMEIYAQTKNFTFANDGTITQDPGDAEAEALEIEVDGYALASGEDHVADAESVSFANAGVIGGTVELELEATAVTIANSGTIGRGLAPDVTIFANGFSGLSVDQETTLGAALNASNSGTISTADYAGTAVALSVEAGSIDSGVPGAETADGAINFANSGTISATGGHFITPGAVVGMPANQNLIDFAVGLAAFVDAEGAGTISITNEADAVIGARGFSHLGLPNGPQLVAGQTEPLGGVAVAAGADAVTIVNHGSILGGPSFSLTLDNGTTLIPNVDLDVDLDLDFEGLVGGAIDTFSSNDDITNSATGVIEGGIALRSGDDVLRNFGAITGDIDFGAGDDLFIQGINAAFTGTANGGDGTDRFLLDITGGGAIDDAIYGQLVNFEVLALTGTGSVTSDAPLPFETIALTGGEPVEFGVDAVIETQGPVAITGTSANDMLIVLGTVNGDVDLGAGNNSFVLGGTVNGDVVFGTGDDMLELQPGWSIAGTASGGAGQDVLQISVTGSYENPTILDLAGFEEFEELDVANGGVGTVAGQLSFDTINVSDGRLIGLAGSTIVGDVHAAAAGTFGSAGTVNGDVDIDGTLSPGASPGTMTVNGNVTLASGSTSLFEMTPTISDALVINGSLVIESGTTLTISGERPLTPGVTYNLITATDGISGSFTTTNQAETVLGFLRQTSTALQLLGTFQLHDGANAQVAATNLYLNDLLVSGNATGILAAVSQLVAADGFASDAALATIHPEAYASASQIGVENGLAIAGALRSANFAARDEERGLFTFAQGFGSWRNFDADSASGASKADVRSAGFLGGIGYQADHVSVAAFLGHVDARQSLASIGARNDADGIFFGINAQLELSGFRLGGSIFRDRGKADASRSLFDGSQATSHYRLRGTTVEIHAGYGFALGNGWEIGPDVGLTHVSVRRGAASEGGAGAFNLDVAGDRIGYTFLTAELSVRRSDGILRPWLSAGMHQRVDNDRSQATASLAGASDSFTVAGAQRDRSFGNIAIGLDWRLSPNLDIFTRGNGEFGGGNAARSVDVGVKLRF